MNQNKEAAVEFLEMIVIGAIEGAYEKFVDSDGTHHNVHIPAGMDELRKAMKDADAKFPNMKFEIQHVIAEDEMVAVHSHLRMSDKMDFTVVHLFRFSDGKIVEFWDIASDLPADNPNTDGAF